MLHAIDEDGYEGIEIGGNSVEELAEDSDDSTAILSVWAVMIEMLSVNKDMERMFKEVETIVYARGDG